MHVVRVLPDVAGLDKEFDYSVPPELEAEIGIGSRVRVDLHGRRVGGWVVAVGVEPHAGITLRSVAKVTGWGPSADVVDLARWAAWRWAGRPSALLKAASPERAVRALPTNAPAAGPERGPESRPHSGAAEQPYGPGRTLVRVAPAADRMPVIRAVLRQGPALIVAPSSAEAAELGRRLRRDGEPVAVLPEGWAAARAGSCTVVGARSAAWAPAPDAAAMVVLDAHDEVHQEERAPTWHVRDVLGERAARAGVACLAVTPCPDLATVAWADRSAAVDRAVEREGWPIGEVIDLREEDPANGLLSSRLTTLVRGDQRVLCVLNRKGRARLLACAGCQEVARCELCDAAVTQVAAGLVCPRCGSARPVMCTSCGRQRLRVLRPGISRLRDELEALVGEPVGEVSASSEIATGARVVIGTEAVLHRAGRAGVVVFVDFDQELLAPRFRAGEQAMALLARAARIVGGRSRGGRIVVQTRVPDHDVNRALVHGDPMSVVEAERGRRQALGMPPFRAIAAVSGAAAPLFVAALQGPEGSAGIEVIGPDEGMWLVRAPGHAELCDALAAVARPPGRLRIEVDPLRI